MKTKHLRLMQRVYIILFFCFMYLPIAYMIVFSFNQSKGYSLFTGFTLKWYRSLFTNASILHALWVSVEVAIQFCHHRHSAGHGCQPWHCLHESQKPPAGD